MNKKIIIPILIVCILLPCAILLNACKKEKNVSIEVYINNEFVETLTTNSNSDFKITPNSPEDILSNSNINKYFDGWYLDDTYQTKYSIDTKFENDSKIYGKWIDFNINNYNYMVNNGKVTIMSYNNSNESSLVIIPSQIHSNPVEKLEENIFFNITTIEKVIIANGIETIEKGMFKNCTNLKEVCLPTTLKVIKESAFENCENLAEITLPKTLTIIEENAFKYCNLTTLNFLGNINDWVSNSLGKSKILTTISNFYINGTKVNKDLELSNIETIKEYAFFGFRYLDTLKLKNINHIENYAFADCRNIIQLNFENIVKLGDYCFQNCMNLINITIPNSVTNIGEGVFNGCSNMISITLPFVGEHRHTSATIDITPLPFGHIFGTIEFYNSQESESEIAENYFVPKSLTKVTITDAPNVTTYAFINYNYIETIVLSDDIRIIGTYAFKNCENLKEINIPKNLTNLSSKAFENLPNLETLLFHSNNISLGNSCPFIDCSKLAVYFETTTLPKGWRADKWSYITYYLYSESKPETVGNYWHYANNQISIWEFEQ